MPLELKARALVVGVARYDHVTPLPAAVRRDVQDVGALLKDPSTCGYRDNAVTLLIDDGATCEAVRKALRIAAQELEVDESFLFYFSGHGHRETINGEERSYLLASDSRLDNLDNTALRDDELLGLLRALPSERQVILLDACHAGGVGTLKGADAGRQPRGIAKSSLDHLSEGRGRVILASCRADEVSLIMYGSNNSLFTQSLLKALRGEARDRGDGTIGVLDLFTYVAADVPTHADQHPVFKADGLEQNYAVALHAAAKGVGAKTSTGRASGDVATLLASLYPLGPTQSDIWLRAGGDLSRLAVTGHGRAQWHAAVRLIEHGGGGLLLSELLAAVVGDFPENTALKAMMVSSGHEET